MTRKHRIYAGFYKRAVGRIPADCCIGPTRLGAMQRMVRGHDQPAAIRFMSGHFLQRAGLRLGCDNPV